MNVRHLKAKTEPPVCGSTIARKSRYYICYPELYYHRTFQDLIYANRRHRDQNWIFNLVVDKSKHESEIIYSENDDWLLCSHPDSSSRFLVVFKDLTLHSIRDLRQKHIPMLQNLQCKLIAFIRDRFTSRRRIKLFFHYMPSVFQLHMHVSFELTGDPIRVHTIQSVIVRLQKDDLWFHKALILCPLRRMLTHLHLNCIEFEIH